MPASVPSLSPRAGARSMEDLEVPALLGSACRHEFPHTWHRASEGTIMAKSRGRDKEKDKTPKKRRREKEDSSPSSGRHKKHRKSSKDSKRKTSSREKDSRKKSSSSKDKKKSKEKREDGGKGESVKHGVQGGGNKFCVKFKFAPPPHPRCQVQLGAQRLFRFSLLLPLTLRPRSRPKKHSISPCLHK